MKISKIIIAALVVMAGAAVTTATAKKKEEAPKKGKAPAAVALKSASDSISFAAGYANTQGLIPFLQQQFKVDTTYMADFVQGLSEAKEKANDPRFIAYQAGTQIANMIRERMLEGLGNELKGTDRELNKDMFYAGFIAALNNDTANYNMAGASKYFQTSMEAIKADKDANSKVVNEQWLADNAKNEGVVTLPSGLQYKVITEGKGEKPVATSEVEVKYEGKLIDGTVFDSSYRRNPQTTKFKANQVIKGWTEALCLMPVGSTWELYIPQELGYGETGAGSSIPPYATLIFKVELVSVKN